jgi:peroxiredoxin
MVFRRTVFGLTTAGPHQNRKLRHRLDLGFPILGDPSRTLHQQFDLWLEDRGHAMPGIIFLNEDGGVAKIHRVRYPGQRQERRILRELRRISGSD